MSNKKNIKLRAFSIHNTNTTEPDAGILKLLRKVLTDTSTAGNRRMRLNEEDSDEDLLSNFSWQNDNYLFGMMLRIIPAAKGGTIESDLFTKKTISIADISTGDTDASQYKDHYYFAINNKHLVTNLSGVYSIDRLQTYINWLLEEHRNKMIFGLDPVTKLPEGLKLSEIKGIEFNGGNNSRGLAASTMSDGNNYATRVHDVAWEMFKNLLKNADDYSDILQENIISAKLVLRVKNKPKDMEMQEYQRVMSAATRQITNDNGVSIITKGGNRYNGDAVKVTKNVDVERTSTNRIVEEHLKQQFEIFLAELNKGDV